MNKLTWSKPSRYNMEVLLGLPDHITIAIAPYDEPEADHLEAYLTNKNIASFTKQKQVFGTIDKIRKEAEKWAREITGMQTEGGPKAKNGKKLEWKDLKALEFFKCRESDGEAIESAPEEDVETRYALVSGVKKDYLEVIWLGEEEIKTARETSVFMLKGEDRIYFDDLPQWIELVEKTTAEEIKAEEI